MPIKKSTFFTALFFSIFFLFLGYGETSFELIELKNLIISRATADGFEVQSRIDLFYGLIFKLIILLLFHLFIFSFLFQRCKINTRQQAVLLLLSSIGISLLMLQVIGIEADMLILVLLLILLYKIIIYGFANNQILGLKIYKAEALSNTILAYGFLIYLAFLYLTGVSNFLVSYFVSVICLSLIYPLLFKYTNYSLRKINYLFAPLALFSILVFVSTELFIFLTQEEIKFLGYEAIFLLLFFLFTCVFYYIVFHKRKTYSNVSSYFKKYLAPAVIIAYCLLIYYFPIPDQNTEMFELGNPANAIMRIFRFGEIPLVDFMSSHLFAEQWYGIIYSLLFGYNNYLDFQIYFFFNRLLFLLVVYFTLNKLFKHSAYSLLFVLVFPFLTEVFSNDLIFCVLPFIIIQNTIKHSTTKSYFFLFASLLLLIVWKIDTGYAALISTFFYFIILLITQAIKVEWKHFWKGLLLTLSIVFGLLILVILLRDGNYILNNFKAALHYVSGNQAHGSSEIAHNYIHQFYISYFFLPSIAVLSVLYIVYILWQNRNTVLIKKRELFILKVSLFFFLIALANAQRGIVRHGYAEYNDGAIITTFYFAAALLILFVWRNYISKNKWTVFYVLCYSLFLGFRFFPYEPEYVKFDQAIKKNALLTLDEDILSMSKSFRTKPNHGFYYHQLKEFKNFVDDNLSKEETFLDFSNSPMLYYYSGKRVPGYFCQNLQNSIDDFTQFHLLNQINPKEVPVVVFSSFPKTWFDQTDGIPNTMRYYWIAEYIYQNYKPYAIMSKKRIWLAKNFQIKRDISTVKDTLSNTLRIYDYRKAAHYIHDFYERKDYSNLEKIKTWSHNVNDSVFIADIARNNAHAYLLFEFEKPLKKAAPRFVLYDSLGNKRDLFKFEIHPDLGNKYMIRISNSEHWHNGNAIYLELENKENVNIKSILLYKDIRREN